MEPRVQNASGLPLRIEPEWQELCAVGKMNKIYFKIFQHNPLCYVVIDLLIGKL